MAAFRSGNIGLATTFFILAILQNSMAATMPRADNTTINILKLLSPSLNWTGDPCLQLWTGVQCNTLGQIVSLNLTSKNLIGPIPPQLGNLSSLTFLNLSLNSLTGPLPTELSNLHNLEVLDLATNNLNGSIPPAFGSLSNLLYLNLAVNNLSGLIPLELANLSNLTTLNLTMNNLTGAIPTELQKLHNLNILCLNDNDLTGTIPPELSTLTNLGKLLLSQNNLTGTIPPQLSILTNLKHLFLHENFLEGPIPISFGEFPNLTVLTLYRNNLNGTIPRELGSLPQLETLSLFQNTLTGSIPVEITNLSKLGILALYQNQLTGIIPEQLGALGNLTVLGLFKNQFSGPIPTQLGNLLKLNYLGLYDNNLTGTIPPELANLRSLIGLSLANNRLTGPIPSQFGTLNLTILDLTQNFLNGTVPPGLKLDSTVNRTVITVEGVSTTLTSSPSSVALNCIGLSPVSFYQPMQRDSQVCAEFYPDLTCKCTGSQVIGINGSCYCVVPFQVKLLFTFESEDTASNFSTSLPVTMQELARIMSVDVQQLAPVSFLPSLRLGTIIFVLNLLPLNGTVLPRDQLANANLSLHEPQNFSIPFFKNGFIVLDAKELVTKEQNVPNELVAARSSHKQRNAAISTSAAALVMAVAVACIAVAVIRRKKIEKKKSLGRMLVEGSSVKSWLFSELENATDGFSKERMIGEGGFGIVYQAELEGISVAIKRLGVGASQGHAQFVKEVEVVGEIHHRNLVSLRGYCAEGTERLLVYDFMDNGSLEDWLFDHRRGHLDWTKSMKILLGAANALSYLHHECKQKIIHRDIKPANILLDSDFEAHLSDFGIARSARPADTHVTTRVMGTFGFMAPEYAQTGQLTERSDVYSFGVVILTVVSDQPPVERSEDHRWIGLVEVAQTVMEEDRLLDIVSPHLSSTLDPQQARRMLSIALLCVQSQFEQRPSMERVLQLMTSVEDIPPSNSTHETVPMSPGSSLWTTTSTQLGTAPASQTGTSVSPSRGYIKLED